MQPPLPRPGPRRIPAAGLFALVLAGSPAAAGPTADLSWNACAPIVADIPAGSAGTYSMYASVTGQEEAHQAYEVWLLLSDANLGLPDAWAFQGTGCQGSGRVAVAFAPRGFEAADCPAFKGATNSLDLSAFQQPYPNNGGSYPTTIGQIVLLSTYPGGYLTPDPQKRYFLGRIDFDHSASVLGKAGDGECGGFGNGITFRLQPGRVGWLAMDNSEHVFDFGNQQLTFAGGAGPGITVDAVNATWGHIKAQYRR